MGFCLSQSFLTATSTEKPPLPMNPKTRIKTIGNASVNTTAEGLRKMERRLAFVIASMAVICEYFLSIVNYSFNDPLANKFKHFPSLRELTKLSLRELTKTIHSLRKLSQTIPLFEGARGRSFITPF